MASHVEGRNVRGMAVSTQGMVGVEGEQQVMIASNQVGPTLEQKVERLMVAVAVLATEIDMADELPRPSAEELIERILYPENFGSGTVAK